VADIRCPNCGKNNPDFLDVCQFCQTPLTPESMVHIGEKPTKKNTGELENVLPDWLRDVRQQARDSAEEDAVQAASMPKVQKEEPPDLLAGLAFQSESRDEEQVPDWLSSIRPATKEPSTPPTPAEPETDFFAQFNKSEPTPKSEPAQDNVPSLLSRLTGQPKDSPERDELSEWFTQASEQPVEPSSLEPDVSQIDSGWGSSAEAISAPEEKPAPREEEDLSWLRNLEAASKQTGELSTPKQEGDWLSEFGSPSAPAQSSEPEDLNWLNNLGAIPAPQEPAQQSSQPQEDLSWLNAFSETPEPSQPASAEPVPQDDLSWLNKLGGTSEPSQTFDFAQDKPSEEPSSQDDLSWLNELQGSAEPLSAKPFSGQPFEQDKSKDEQEQADVPHVSPFTPRRTAPLSPEEDTSIPDWLKSATEGPSMPVGADALDQFREDFKIPTAPEEPFSWKSFVPEAKEADEEPAPSQPQSASVEPFSSANDTSTLSNQEVDSLFSMNMPDWLSRPEPAGDESAPQEIAVNAEGGEALSPVDLPSWVQAMRPVEAIISETASSIEDQPTEREGPLAGFRGVIPAVQIGSSRRPKPISLKLQASNEQQTSATILEQILLGETAPRPLVSAPEFISQRVLRWVLTGLFLLVLGTTIGLRSQQMPVSALLPIEARDVTSLIMNIPDDAPLLVILDYEPALAGEMEAASGPLLDQLVLLRHPHMSFLTTSLNGTALVERLLVNTNINQPDGYGYRVGQNYINMGYLPGGESGVLAFIQSPPTAIPSSPVLGFSEYAAIIMLTDHADSARVWVEQLQNLKEIDPALTNQPLLIVSSAQAGPLLQPYVASRQVNGLISGLSDAARYEFVNNSRPGIARSYWDAFGVGLMMAIALIILGNLWSVFTLIRARRAEAGEA
jgi:hypothetical protein